MSRTTTALKRLGVPSLAAITLVAGLPLFLGTAQAAHIDGIDLKKVGDADAAGVCIPYSIQVDFTDTPTAQVVDVTLTDSAANSDAQDATQDVDFCTASYGSATPAAPSDLQDGGAAGTDHAEFTTNADGFVIFGIIGNQAGSAVDIRAFYETTDGDTFTAGEFTDTAVQTFGPGGTAGSNTNQDAATTVEVLNPGQAATATVTTVTTDDDDTAVEGEARTYRVAVTNTDGDRLAGVTVSYTRDGASPTTFGTTDNNGVVTGQITFPADGTDEIVFYVNQSDGILAGPETTEPQDAFTVTVIDNATQQNRSIVLVPEDDNSFAVNNETSAGNAVNDTEDETRTFTAVVDATDADTSSAGTLLAFTLTGGNGDETLSANECSTTNYTAPSGTDNNDSACTVTVTDPTPTIGQPLTLTATVRGNGANDTATLTFRNSPNDARFITLTPATVNVAPNTAQQLTATVTDVDGNTVQGVLVTFTESGAGAFRNGSSRVDTITDANGVATVETISLPGETGTQTVTATIDPAVTGGPANQSGQAANTGTDPQGNSQNATTNTAAAGVASDSSTVTFGGTASAPPSTPASPSGPPAVPCTVPASITLDRTTIIATGSAQITVRATPNSVVQVFAYSRPSTQYRVVRNIEIGGDGVATDRIVPPTNTRLYAQQQGCNASPSIVLNVRTQISLNVVRNGVRNYTFSGRLLPARPGGLIASLYRVTNDGRQILTAQTRASATTGQYTIVRQFTGSGRFGFVVRTGQDLQNAPGSSNVRSLAVF